MKNLIYVLCVYSVLVGTAGFAPGSARAGLCDDPLRDQTTCLRMKHLKASIGLLDAQRDLLQVNYPFLATVADDMRTVTDEILKDDQNGHLAALQKVGALASQLGDEARKRNVQSLVSANQFRAQCMNCHSNTAPASGYKWEDISGGNWEDVWKKCNEPEHLPYLCKNMHGMASSYNYFLTAWDARVRSFDSTAQIADEIIRISTDLLNKGMTHGATGTLVDLQKEGVEIRRMTVKRDPGAFERSRQMVQACFACHGSVRAE